MLSTVGLIRPPLIFSSCTGSDLFVVCVCCRLNKLCVDQLMEGKHELVNGKSHSLTSSALVDGPIQTQTLTPSRSAGPLSTTGEETQIREKVSKMNHSAKMTLVTEEKKKSFVL